MKTPILVIGAFGRMGRGIIEQALDGDDFLVVGACVRPGATDSQNRWPLKVYDDIHAAIEQAEHKPCALMDFSTKDCLSANLAAALKYRLPIMVGTTGHDDIASSRLAEAASRIPVLYAPNTSLMANLLMVLSAISARTLGQKAQGHIVDLHHQHKKDAPSGTALALKKAMESQEGVAQVQITSQRIGDVAGEHTVYFFKDNERLELCHRVGDRRVLVEGALIAAQFIFQQGPGLYGMNDVLNLGDVFAKQDKK